MAWYRLIAQQSDYRRALFLQCRANPTGEVDVCDSTPGELSRPSAFLNRQRELGGNYLIADLVLAYRFRYYQTWIGLSDGCIDKVWLASEVDRNKFGEFGYDIVRLLAPITVSGL